MSDNYSRMRAFEQSVLLLAPSFGWYRGQYQLPKERTSVEISGHEVDMKSVTMPRAKLMTDTYPTDRNGIAWKKRFQAIESQKDKVINRYSVPFPITGVRIVPLSQGDRFLEEIAAVRSALDAASDEFCSQLDEVLREIEENLDPVVWNWVRDKIPNRVDDMKAKFYVDVVPVRLSSGTADEVTLESLREHQADVREACRRKVEEAIESMIARPREELAEALANLRELVERNGRVTSRSFNPVREAIAKLRDFSFAADEVLLEQITQLEDRLDRTTPASLDQATAASSGFTAALNSVLGEVQDAARQAADMERFGRNLRGIEI